MLGRDTIIRKWALIWGECLYHCYDFASNSQVINLVHSIIYRGFFHTDNNDIPSKLRIA